MARHAARSDSRYHQIQERVPKDLVERLRGSYVVVECPAMGGDTEARISLKLGEKVKGSLQTRDEAVATARRLRILEHLSRFYAAARAGGSQLNHQQMVGLAGEVYALLRANFDADPGDWTAWEAWKGFVRAAREGRIPTAPTITPGELADERAEAARLFGPDLTQGIDALPPSGDRAALEDRCGRLTWWVLSRHGLHVDRATRIRLLEHVADACLDAGWALKRAAKGDYTPDPKALRFPKFEARPAGITLTQLFERWKAEINPAASTVTTWRSVTVSLAKVIGHEDATRITPEEIVKFKDHRLRTPSPRTGRIPDAKTINDQDLTCLRALFSWGIANKLLTANPAEGVKVSAKKKAGTRKLPYEDAEMARLLALCAAETNPVRRWVPLLLATSGARVGEILQLWAERVREIEGVPCMVLSPAEDGGTFKNEASERTVPLHPAVIEAGFLDFVREKGNGALFYGGKRRADAERHASKGAANHLAQWIREQGFTDPRKAPNHALRHWWKSAAAEAGIQDSLADHIQGHARKDAADDYRHFHKLPLIAAAVAKIRVPVPRREPADDGAMPAEVQPQTGAV